MNFNLNKVQFINYQQIVCFLFYINLFKFINKKSKILDEIPTYFIGKRRLSHRITRKPPQMTLATAAAFAVASGVSLSVPLNDTNYISNQSQLTVRFYFLIK